jgi:hypothetical protein
MTDQELNRAIQYVTASTSYAREIVADIINTGLGELAAIASQSSRQFERATLLEYVTQWAIKRTGQPEPLVREVLGCASRWLDEVYEEVAKRQPEALGLASSDDEGRKRCEPWHSFDLEKRSLVHIFGKAVSAAARLKPGRQGCPRS